MGRKLWILIAIAAMTAAVCCGTALADPAGTCGDNVGWDFNTATGILTISGTGPMWDYDDDDSSPDKAGWNDFKAGITGAVIGDGVTYVGAYAFHGCTALTEVHMISRTSTFGSRVFENCPADLILYGYADSTAQAYAEANSITFKSLPFEYALSGSGTANNPWQINSTADWNHIALALENGTDTSENHFRLGANISVSTMIGTESNPFHGHVDGAGNTLTVSLTVSERGRGPFAFVSDASFEHLRVTGTITTSVHDAGGLVGHATDCSITDCVSDIHIIAHAGNGHAGFIGALSGEDSAAIDGSLYTGTIEGSTSYCAGFTGRGGGLVDNSIYDGTIRGVSNNNTFLRMRNQAANCYYLNAENIQRIKGQQARAVTADEGVSIHFGEGTAYNVSGIIAYPVGLSYNGTFYAGYGETVALHLSATPRDGFAAFFTASAGMLTRTDDGWSLLMPDEDVMIHATYEPLSGLCGDHLSWIFDETTGTLTISGTGKMGDYSSVRAGWYVYRDMIKAVLIEDGVTSVGKSAFQNCTALTGIVLPDSVTAIGSYAFRGCSALTGATIPASVTSLGANAFAECSSGLVLYGETGSIAEAYANYYGIPFEAPAISGVCGEDVRWTLDPVIRTLTIKGSGAMRDFSYSECPNWIDYQDRIDAVIIEDGVTQIGAYTFYNLSEMKTVQIPSSISAIGRLAFYGCSGLSEVVFPDGLSSIGNNAFYNCSGLAGIEIPQSVASVGYQAFQGCSNLTEAMILNPNADIGTRAFASCDPGLILTGYPNSTTHRYANHYDIPFVPISEPTFFLPSGLVSIEDDAFSGIAAVSVYIPDTILMITGNPFAESTVAYIYGAPGSVAERFADAQGYIFLPVDDDWIDSH